MWTDERVDTLKALWAKGHSASHIAGELMHVTRNGVIGKIHRLGLAPRSLGRKGEGTRKTKYIRSTRFRPPPARATTVLALEYDEATDIKPELLTFEHATRLIDLHMFERQENRRLCRWPLGDPSPTMPVCGAVAVCTYCRFHTRVAYQPIKDRRVNLYGVTE